MASLSVAENIAPGPAAPSRRVRCGWSTPAPMRGGGARALDLLGVAVPLDAAVGAIGVAHAPAGDHRARPALRRAAHHPRRADLVLVPGRGGARCSTSLRRLRARGIALVYISHRLEELRAIADRVTVLRDGRVVTTAPMAAVRTRRSSRAMSGRELAADLRRAPPPRGRRSRGWRARPHAARHACTRITLEVREGEVVGLAGLDGRRPLAHAAHDLRRRLPRAGTVRCASGRGRAGAPCTRRGRHAAGMGLVPEDRRAPGARPHRVGAGQHRPAHAAGRAAAGAARRRVLRAVARRRWKRCASRRARGIDEPVRSSPAATSRRWCWAAGWARTRGCCCSTSPRAAWTCAPRPRSIATCAAWPRRAGPARRVVGDARSCWRCAIASRDAPGPRGGRADARGGHAAEVLRLATGGGTGCRVSES